MIQLKTPEEIEIMTEGGKRLNDIREKTFAYAQVGMSTLELDSYADKLIKQSGGRASFKTVGGYNWATCISLNDGVVHGIPKKSDIVTNGDVLSIDVGLIYKGLHTDTSWTKRIWDKSSISKVHKQDKIDIFIQTGQKALEKAINQVQIGNRIGHISQAIQDTIERAGYSVVEGLVGHGVGHTLHEDPEIPGLLTRPIKKTPKLQIGMVLAVEAIYNQGESDVAIDQADGWTIRTKDGTLSGLFERTVALTSSGGVVLT